MLTNRRKAAILLITLGQELSARLFQYLSEEEVEQLTLEIATVQKIPPEVRQKVIEEAHQMAVAQDYIAAGGLEYARQLLERALGTQRAVQILERLTSSLQVRPFDFIRRADPSQLISYLQNEHPQTIALVLAYAQPQQAAMILSALPAERQADVARRIALMDRTSPDVVREVERVLEHKLSALMLQDYTAAGGIETVVKVLNQVDRSTERGIMEILEINDPELAEEIKQRMFVFEDIVLLDNRALQRVLREVDMHDDLPKALKVASDDVKEKIFSNISKRAAEMLKENIEYMGPVRLRDVEEAQQRIVSIIRRLEEEGEIFIVRGQGDEVVV
ncbi:MAG: flagellar motor switch protein FliG [Bacillota bacterium]|nr:flagellar motor switch protein FliG [Bacillota bacterium]REJ37660.1 MAG: flagellar motor switch protein FliG [Bacillota bacterium]